MRKRAILALLAAGLVLVLGLGAAALVLFGSDDPVQRAEPRATPTPTPTSSAPPKPKPPQRSLLSGRLGRKDGPLLAVKIDNTGAAHPQAGLAKADVVYIEQVEGGVTRLVALYSSELPKTVAPVRSARITDIELLRQYGTVGLAYSGAQKKLVRKLKRSKYLRLASFDESRRGYTRSPARPMPYDVIGYPRTLLQRVGKVDRPKRVGYSFGAAPAGGRAAHHVTVQYPGARVDAVWSAARKRWMLAMDGRADRAAEGGQLGPTTFVVQYVTVTRSAYHDFRGSNTPFSSTVGSGKALIFRDGRVYQAAWSRWKPSQPTAYSIGGKRAVFAPGQVWVALVAKNRPARVS